MPLSFSSYSPLFLLALLAVGIIVQVVKGYSKNSHH